MDRRRVTTTGARLAAASGICLAFSAGFVLVYYFTVRTVSGRHLGDAAIRGALLTHGLLHRVVGPLLSVVSVASLLAAVALVGVIALMRQERAHGLAAIAVLGGSNVSTLVLKRYLLSRPDFGIREVSPSTLNSLPSGHSAAAFSAVVALMFVLPTVWRRPVALLGVGYAGLTGVSTMSAGWHRAGDSMAAFLLVGCWAAATVIVVIAVGAGQRTASARPAGVEGAARPWWEVTTVGLLGLGGAGGLLLASQGALRRSGVGPPLAFLAGGVLIVGVASAVLIGVTRLLDLMER